MLEADFVIIGSGSAGSAMAYRLSEDGKHSVIVIEYGGTDFGPLIQMPSALSIPLNMSLYDWGYCQRAGTASRRPRARDPARQGDRRLVLDQRHGLCQGPRPRLRPLGRTGCGRLGLMPTCCPTSSAWKTVSGGEDGWRGTSGPLHVQRGPRKNPLYGAFVEAGRAGWVRTDRRLQRFQAGRLRADGADHPRRPPLVGGHHAYLKPALKRGNVRLVNGFARRVIIENQRAVGVEIEAHKQIQVVKARREVIVAASSINSPKILMLSGIGPAAHLKENGIDVVADRRGVGRNLQDHMELYIQQESTQPITLHSVLNPFSKALIGAQWLFFKTGLGATNHFEAAAFVRSKAGVDYPDIQYHFMPAAVRYDGKAAAKSHGFQAHVGPMRSKSRGSVTLRSPIRGRSR
jgi:choline dehydrogenase